MSSRVGSSLSSGIRSPDRMMKSSSHQPKHSTPIKDYVKPVLTPGYRARSKSNLDSTRDSKLRNEDDGYNSSRVAKMKPTKDGLKALALGTDSMKKSRRHHVSPGRPSSESSLSIVRDKLSSSLAHCEDLTETCSSNGLSMDMQAKITEFENNTISKQRQELQLLVGELKDRDRELNEMVATHQRQMAAWERDRQKIINLEENLERLQRELQERNHDYRSLQAKLRTAESEELSKSTALNSTQEQLAAITEQHSQTTNHLLEVEGNNKSLNNSLRDLSVTVGQLEAREEELLAVLKLKDRDLSEASSHIAELNVKMKHSDVQLQNSRDAESAFKRQVSSWKNKLDEATREIEHLKREILKHETEGDDYQLEIHKLRQDLSTTKKEVVLANEREKRKEQLLQLQKSKQERTDAELSNLRKLYERQQRDLSLLHLNLESTKELLKKTSKSPNSLNNSLRSLSPTRTIIEAEIALDEVSTYVSRSHRTLSPPRPAPYRSTSPGSILRRDRSKSPGTSAGRSYIDRIPSPERDSGIRRHRSTSPANPLWSARKSPERVTFARDQSKSPVAYTGDHRSRSPGIRRSDYTSRYGGSSYEQSSSPLRRSPIHGVSSSVSHRSVYDSYSSSRAYMSPYLDDDYSSKYNYHTDIHTGGRTYTDDESSKAENGATKEADGELKEQEEVTREESVTPALDNTELHSSGSSHEGHEKPKEDEAEEVNDVLEAERPPSRKGSRARRQSSESQGSSGRGTATSSNRPDQDVISEKSAPDICAEQPQRNSPSEGDQEAVCAENAVDDLFEGKDTVRGRESEGDSEPELDRSLNSRSSTRCSDRNAPSLRDTDSPATKLHKLLVESCDMVQDLERSATSSTMRDDESERHATPERDPPNDEKLFDLDNVTDSDC